MKHLSFLAPLAALLIAGCGGGIGLPYERPAGEAVKSAHLLQYKREQGTKQRHRAKFDVRVRQREMALLENGRQAQRDRFESDETTVSEVSFFFPGRTPDDAFDRVVPIRHDFKRDLLEITKEETVTRDEGERRLQPSLSPNFGPEFAERELIYYPMDELGRIARRDRTPFHYAWYDSLAYMFPIFPAEPVRIGDRWTYRMPVIVGKQVANNIFDLEVEFRFAALNRLDTGGSDGPLVATITYTYHGTLDSSHPGEEGRLPETGGVHRIRDAVEGKGEVRFDLEGGRVLWKNEDYRILVEREFERAVRKKDSESPGDATPDGERTERVRHTSVNTVKMESRLLGRDERATERPARVDR